MQPSDIHPFPVLRTSIEFGWVSPSCRSFARRESGSDVLERHRMHGDMRSFNKRRRSRDRPVGNQFVASKPNTELGICYCTALLCLSNGLLHIRCGGGWEMAIKSRSSLRFRNTSEFRGEHVSLSINWTAAVVVVTTGCSSARKSHHIQGTCQERGGRIELSSRCRPYVRIR